MAWNYVRNCKKTTIGKNMVIMLQTTNDATELKAQAFALGVTDFITKPLHQEEVMSRAMAHLERQFLHRQLEEEYAINQQELIHASKLQHLLVPQDIMLDNVRQEMGIDIACYYRASDQLSGDYLSVRRISEHQIAIISADISGHGISAALYTFSMHTMLQDKLLELAQPHEVLEMLNVKLYQQMPTGKFATMFLGVIDTEKQELAYSAAASPMPIALIGKEKKLLNSKGYLLGTTEHADYITHRIPFHPGDMFFLHSDTLVETTNPRGDFMRNDRISDIIEAHQDEDATTIQKNDPQLFLYQLFNRDY
jgi:phosphoserine phosphatase RsbU/P